MKAFKLDFCEYLLNDSNSSASTISYCQRLMRNLANQKNFSDETNQRIVDFMLASDRFDLVFWFGSLSREFASPKFIAAIERKAVDTILQPTTTLEDASFAIGTIASIQEFEMLDRKIFELPNGLGEESQQSAA